MTVRIFGPNYSTYVRTVRLTLEEKGVPYELIEVDVLKGQHKEGDYLSRQPFARVPAFEHDGFALYETAAVTAYIDRTFGGQRLTPDDPKCEARMRQIIGIIDAYGYPAFITRLFIQRAVMPMQGGSADETIIQNALPQARLVMGEIERLRGSGPWLAGHDLSLADLHLAPIVAYLTMIPEGTELLNTHKPLQAWWQHMSERPSMQKTAPKLG
jgi:glutathione S-transferase